MLLAAFVLASTLATPFAARARSDGATPTRPWDLTVGLGASSEPRFPGSDRQRSGPTPLVDARWGPVYLSPDPIGTDLTAAALGVGVYRDPTKVAAIQLSYPLERPRDDVDAPRLAGVGDIRRTVRLGAIGRASFGRFAARGAISTDVGGNDQGVLATLWLDARFEPVRSLSVTAGPFVTWNSSDYGQTFFGIDGVQSARSGLAPFDAGSGIGRIGVDANATYRIDRRWGLLAFGRLSWLQGDAADSPITLRRGQHTFKLLATYTW
jgi:outer membrane protein